MRIFIDGSDGATGVVLNALLSRSQHEIITISDGRNRKDDRYAAINESDIAVLCLPEHVVAETYADNQDTDTVIIDASSFSRLLPDWTYGYYYDVYTGVANVVHSRRISNPGCFATGMQTLLHPIQSWLKDYPIIVNGISGYSAGGKAAITRFNESPWAHKATNISRPHTHVSEVKMRSNIDNTIVFMPSVGSFYEGQMVSIPLAAHQLSCGVDEVHHMISQYYGGLSMVEVMHTGPGSIILPNAVDDSKIQVAVADCGDYVILHTWYNNLTAGAAGSVCRIIDKIAEQQGNKL